MDAPLDPLTVEQIGGILAKGGNAATLLLAYFGYRIFTTVRGFLSKFLERLDQFTAILDRLDRHISAAANLPDTRPGIIARLNSGPYRKNGPFSGDHL